MKIIKGYLGNKYPVWEIINKKGEKIDWFDRLTENSDGLEKEEVIYILEQRKINLNQEISAEKYKELIINQLKTKF